MTRLMRILKRIAWSIAVIGAIILMIRPAILAYEWVAWHVWTKEFQAVCTEYAELSGDEVDHFHVVGGPYTDEFWQQLRIAYSEFPKQLKPEWAHWQDDGSLRVPVGFDFEPDRDERLDVMGHWVRPRERSHVISTWAAYDIFQNRKQRGADLQPYERFAFTDRPQSYPPTIRGNSCGFMHELITVGGALATEDADAGERP